ncbi:hypothetical protein ACFUC1_05215 [Pedococcus sp. NPDC057267]|uniref:hypothetical protein n=1 Tax=Pedococcus sp. NPDC057267 TaxID=3346077 RepID=UPI0036280198
MRKNGGAFAITIAAAMVLAFTSPAEARNSNPDEVTINVAGESLTMTADMASRVQDPVKFSQLTVEQLAAVGIHANMGHASVHGAFIPDSKSGGIQPNNASGCDWTNGGGSVCIYVFGSGLHVSEWDTSAKVGAYRCTYASYWINNGQWLITTGPELCGQNGTFWSYWKPNADYLANRSICNTWVGIAGKPCETITP